MSVSRAFASLAAILVAAAESLPSNADAATLSLVGSNTKVCQLIGDADWATGQATAAQTFSRFGLYGVDLGFPVDSGSGPLFFLFGDTFDSPRPAFSSGPDDALGWTTRRTPPDSETCLDLELATSAPKTFARPAVRPPIRQGTFNVPSGGVFLDDTFYAFFWTDHCVSSFFFPLEPDPDTPLRLPSAFSPASWFCPQKPNDNSLGRSVLTQAMPANPVDFRWATAPNPNMPSGFVYVSAAKPPPEIAPGVDWRQRGIPVFGVARYRASIPYLAVAPRETFGDPETWSFFAGLVAGQPVWVTRQQWESGRNANGEWLPPAGAEIYEAQPADERCVGEHSVTWNAPLRTWLLLYNCGHGLRGLFGGPIKARFAPEPWGPWSPPIVLLSDTHETFCTLIMSPDGCPGLINYWDWFLGSNPAGNFYAPFVMDRFTQDATVAGVGQPKRATIYWLASTWNPYVVVVMQSTLELSE